MAKVLVAFDTVREGSEELNRKHELTFPPAGRDFSREEIIELLPGHEVLCSVFDIPIDAEMITAGTSLRLIANYAVGYNNIDLEAAAQRGITVTNTPHAVVEPTAELAMALMLGCTRRLCEWDQAFRTEQGRLDVRRLQRLGTNLYGKTVGIMGFGNIGAALARRCRAFGMRVLYNKRQRLDQTDEHRLDIQYSEKDDILSSADVVSLHMPLNSETKHFISKHELNIMKKSAILINTARGAVVDEAALVEALQNGCIAGAGLDVFENEDKPLPALYNLPNVCLTPHIGTQTYESRVEMMCELSNNILGFLDGDRPISRVLLHKA